MASADAGLAETLLVAFARRTGVDGEETPRRYLWTDAFAVCGYLGLARRNGAPGTAGSAADATSYRDLATRLIDQVHHVLGRHRDDDPRRGWISGLDEEEAERHPTQGGLRIGKELPERGPDEPLDPRREWDRDGQYFHYLTRWMHALNRTSQETGENRFHRWARELAVSVHGAFTRRDRGRPRMVWKMSVDLTRPLVPSMGHHDPLDALVTYLDLGSAFPRTGEVEPLPDLSRAIADADVMCAGRDWKTDDALGIGGLLVDAYRLGRMVAERGMADRQDLLDRLLDDAFVSLSACSRTGSFDRPAEFRLGFRELGLSLGVRAAAAMGDLGLPAASAERARRLGGFLVLADRIEEFWSRPASREARAWRDHGDINDVMLAASLDPIGYLGAASPS